jgi:hypothetical protein
VALTILFVLLLFSYRLSTGNWKKITELVATRSCTQVRTHAQKYFLAMQKPEGGEASPTADNIFSTTKPRKKLNGLAKKSRLLEDASSLAADGSAKRIKKKFKYTQGGGTESAMIAAVDSPPSWLYGGRNDNGVKRGLSGMNLLAQAAMVDPDFEKMDQTVEEYEKRHGKPTLDEISSEEDDSADDDEVTDDVPASIADVEEKRLPKKLKFTSAVTSQSSPPTDLKQENLKLREQLQIADQTVQHMRQEVRVAEARAIEALEGRNIAINECRELQEMNNQLRAEHRRLVMSIEKSNQFGGPAPQTVGSAGNVGGHSLATSQTSLAVAGLEQHMQGLFPSMAANTQSHQIQHQDQIVIEVLQSRLKEAELRYHHVTESLTRQTSVLTDQHRAVMDLKGKLEMERTRRQALEVELDRVKRHTSR